MAENTIISEEVSKLFEGLEVSGEQIEKFAVTLEAVVSEKVKSLKEQLESEKEQQLAEAVEANKAEMEEQVNKYLDYVVSEWVEENRLAIESGIRMEIAESFINGMKSLFENHYIEVPEGKEDILESTLSKVDSLEEDLNEQIELTASLKAEIAQFKKSRVLAQESANLTETQKEKLSSLVEDVEFSSEEAFAEKVKTIRESYFTKKASEEVLSESVEPKRVDDKMSHYLKAL